MHTTPRDWEDRIIGYIRQNRRRMTWLEGPVRGNEKCKPDRVILLLELNPFFFISAMSFCHERVRLNYMHIVQSKHLHPLPRSKRRATLNLMELRSSPLFVSKANCGSVDRHA